MSAPTPAPGDESPREGYYPDPSIPGYVRYWNGAAWVPGTSRPAPAAGETLARPPGVSPAPSVEEGEPADQGDAPRQSAIPHQGAGPVERADIPGQPGPESAPERAGALLRPGIPEQPGPEDHEAGGPAADGRDRPRFQDRHEDAADRRDEPARPGRPDRPHEDHGSTAPERPHGTDSTDSTDGGDSTDDAGPGGRDVGTGARPGRHAGRSEPASAWGADASLQSGFGDRERRVTWGAARDADPGTPRADWSDTTDEADGTRQLRAVEPGDQGRWPEGTMSLRAVEPGASQGGSAPSEEPGSGAAGGGHRAGAPDETVALRRPGPVDPPPDVPGAPPRTPDGSDAGTVAIRALRPGGPQSQVPPQPGGQLGPFGGPQGPQTTSPPPAGPPATTPYFPQQAGTPGTPGAPAGPGVEGAPSWGQAARPPASPGGYESGEPFAPWKPPVQDPFLAAAQEQAAARPAPLGRRCVARLIDLVVVGAVTALAAVPLVGKAVDHVQDKIDAVERAGETATVWLVDGTTVSCVGAALAVLLVFGVLYETLPTVKWGRTLGKQLCGLQVRDIEAHDTPGFAAALRRWLALSVPLLLVVGVIGVLWCLVDRPWRQCWHDKAAHTFVAS